MTNYIALAIPLFFVFIGLEVVVARRRKLKLYRLTDSMTDLSAGTLQQVLMIFVTPLLLAAYLALYAHRAHDFPASSAAPWIIAFFGVDFAYYWWHRASHRVNFIWASHVQHHQSEEYNLSVALRQSITSAFTSFPFYAGLALIGIPPIVYATILSFSTLYQFWIHTELVGTLGPFEYFLNTPSQHRVHHAINPRYLDKNYAATLCIWDRMFGTFEKEGETCVYGLVKPLASFQPLWAQVHRYVEVFRFSMRAPALIDKLRVWWKGPEWSVPGLPPLAPPPEVTRETRPKYDPHVAPGVQRYLWLQLALTMGGAFVLLFFQNRLAPEVLVCGSLLIAITCGSWGALIERKPWALQLELFRLALLAAGGLWLVRGSMFALFPMVLCVGMAGLILAARAELQGETAAQAG